MRRDAGALLAERLLGDLDDDFLASAQQVADGRGGGFLGVALAGPGRGGGGGRAMLGTRFRYARRLAGRGVAVAAAAAARAARNAMLITGPLFAHGSRSGRRSARPAGLPHSPRSELLVHRRDSPRCLRLLERLRRRPSLRLRGRLPIRTTPRLRARLRLGARFGFGDVVRRFDRRSRLLLVPARPGRGHRRGSSALRAQPALPPPQPAPRVRRRRFRPAVRRRRTLR